MILDHVSHFKCKGIKNTLELRKKIRKLTHTWRRLISVFLLLSPNIFSWVVNVWGDYQIREMVKSNWYYNLSNFYLLLSIVKTFRFKLQKYKLLFWFIIFNLLTFLIIIDMFDISYNIWYFDEF